MAAAKLCALSLMLLATSCRAEWSTTGQELAEVKLPIPYFGIMPPLVVQDSVAIIKCYESLKKVPNCASNILYSFISGQIKLTSDCCNVFQAFGDECVSAIFPFVKLNPEFEKLVHGFCMILAAGEGPAGAPSPVPQQ